MALTNSVPKGKNLDGESPPVIFSFNVPGYQVRVGSSLDRAMLVKFMQRNYAELGRQPTPPPYCGYGRSLPFQGYPPLWWVDVNQSNENQLAGRVYLVRPGHRPAAGSGSSLRAVAVCRPRSSPPGYCHCPSKYSSPLGQIRRSWPDQPAGVQ